MKNSILFMFIFTLFIVGCSNEEVNELQDQNLETNFSTLIEDITSNSEFRDLLNNSTAQLRNENNGNGVMVIDNGFSIIFGILDGMTVYFLGSSASDDYIAFLPNGQARFFAHSSDPLAFVLDLNTFSTTYSSDCLDNQNGRVNASVTGTYSLTQFPFGDVYFIDETSTADVLVGHARVNDAMPIFDEETFEQIGCTEVTDSKTLRVRRISNGNSEQGGVISASLN